MRHLASAILVGTLAASASAAAPPVHVLIQGTVRQDVDTKGVPTGYTLVVEINGGHPSAIKHYSLVTTHIDHDLYLAHSVGVPVRIWGRAGERGSQSYFLIEEISEPVSKGGTPK